MISMELALLNLVISSQRCTRIFLCFSIRKTKKTCAETKKNTHEGTTLKIINMEVPPFYPLKNMLSTFYQLPPGVRILSNDPTLKAECRWPGAVLGIVLVGWHCPQNCQLVETNASAAWWSNPGCHIFFVLGIRGILSSNNLYQNGLKRILFEHEGYGKGNLIFSSWWFQSIWKILVKLDHFPG